MRVRVNALYTYRRNGYDILLPMANRPAEGQVVRVVNLPNAPKANTMGHCYVADKDTGAFIGMVDTASLNRE
jgi:hypothetical protein